MTEPSSQPGGTVDEKTQPQALQRIDGPTALRLLREVVAERPDHVYVKGPGGCQYVRGGGPDCLIAHALVRAGRPIGLLAQNNTLAVDVAGFVFGLTPDACLILSAAQIRQDRSEPWSGALSAAEIRAWGLGVTA